MSVIQKIQEKGAWIIFILIALSMIAFIMMDSSFSRGNFFSNSNAIGKVNGETIDRTDFETKLDQIEKMQAQQGQKAPREEMVNQLWNYTIQAAALQQQYKMLGISYSADELESVLFGPNPPQFMVQQFSNAQGQYDVNAARQAFAQIKKNLNNPQVQQFYNMYIEPLIEQSKAAKYQQLFTEASYAPSWLATKEMTDASAVSSFDYVTVPYSSVPDKDVKVSDADINDYVKKHVKQFTTKTPSRSVNYVTFNAAASSADSNAIKTSLDQLKSSFSTTMDIPGFITSNSDGNTNYYDGYVGGKQINYPNKDIVLAQPVGSVYGPYVDGDNFTLARIVAETPIMDTVTARHILVATSQQDPQTGQMQQIRTDSAAKLRLDSAIAQIKAGASFDSICAIYSDDPGSKMQGGKVENVTPGQMVAEFNDFIFTGHTGENKVLKTNYGMHYVEILKQSGPDRGYKVAYVSKSIEPSSTTINDANTKAQQFAAMSTNLSAFQSNASKSKLRIESLPMVGENDYAFGKLGNNRAFIKWIYDNKVGNVSTPQKVGDDYVVAIVTGVHKAGLEDAAQARSVVEPIVRNQKKAKIIIDSKFKGNTLESFAQSSATQIKHADSIYFANPLIAGIGNEPKIVGASFNKSILNKTSTPIAGTTGVFAISPKSVGAHSSSTSPDQIKMFLIQQLKQISGNGILQSLLNAADIKDNRSKFY